jgi:hypothetical protein
MQDPSPGVALLLPKLRRYFAEFLHHSYLDRLGILYLTTCVGLGYGPCANSLEAFLGSIGSWNSPQRVRITSQARVSRICLRHALRAYTSTTTHWPHYLPASPHRLTTTRQGHAQPDPVSRRRSITLWALSTPDSPWARTHGYRNINRLSIDYACRPRLRSRLTLGGLTWPRNPWSFGGRVSHSSFATHACILTPVTSTTGSHRGFHGDGTLPYPPTPLHDRPWSIAGVMRVPRLRRCA